MDNQQTQLIQKLISESPRKQCKCGYDLFDTATAQVEISALRSGTGKNEIMLVGVLVCRKCGEEVQQSKIIS